MPVSKKSSSSVKVTSSDVKKSKSDPSELSVKEKKIESKPEPPYINLPETMRGIELILSITADYCTYKSSTSNIILEDTLMFEVCLEIKFIDNHPIKYNSRNEQQRSKSRILQSCH